MDILSPRAASAAIETARCLRNCCWRSANSLIIHQDHLCQPDLCVSADDTGCCSEWAEFFGFSDRYGCLRGENSWRWREKVAETMVEQRRVPALHYQSLGSDQSL